MKTKALLAALLTFIAPVAAVADAYIDRQLSNVIHPALRQGGYTIQGTAVTRLLAEGQTQSFTIRPPRGAKVMLVAVGDWDSNDVDMFVHGGESGRSINIDVQDDDMPVCSFVSRGGSYRVTIKVVDTDRPAYVHLVYATR